MELEERAEILEGDFNDLVAKAKEEGATHYEALNGGHVAMWGLWRDVDSEEPHYTLLMKAVGREGYLLSGWAEKSCDEMEPDLEPIARLKAPGAMLILALDADTKNVGFAYGLNEQYLCGGQTRFEGDDADARCWEIAAWIAETLEVNIIGCLAIEDPFAGPNARAALQLARLGGMLEDRARIAGAEVVRVHPSTAKAALAGGKASKEEMMAAAELVAGTVEGEHHADAIGVLFAAQGILKERSYEKAVE